MSGPIIIRRCQVVQEAHDTVSISLDAGQGICGRALLPGDQVLLARLRQAAAAMGGQPLHARHPDLNRLGPLLDDAVQRQAVGALEAVRLDAVSRLHDLPLHAWLGGALSRHLAVAVVLSSPATSGDPLPAGLRRVIVDSAASDLARLAETLTLARDLASPPTELALQLRGQFAPANLAPLLALGRQFELAYIADPCADSVAAGQAFAGALPALAISPHRYPPASLRPTVASGGPQILLVDPIAMGGAEAVRALATFANLTGLEIALTAAAGGAWGARFAAHLGATLSACSQPLIIAREALHELGIADGRLTLDDTAGIDWALGNTAVGTVAP